MAESSFGVAAFGLVGVHSFVGVVGFVRNGVDSLRDSTEWIDVHPGRTMRGVGPSGSVLGLQRGWAAACFIGGRLAKRPSPP